MSAVAVLTPVVVAAWPALSATVVAAAVQLDFTVVDDNQAIRLTVRHWQN